MHQLRVGIVGFGRIGAEHAQWLAQCKNIRATSAADTTEARRQMAQDRGLTVFAEADKLFADREIDAILVSTPTSMHFEHASAALQAGKHVMVEKPMTMNLHEAKQLAELAKSKGLVLSVFHNRRWDADFLAVSAAVNFGVFGKIINIESRLGQWASCVGPAAKEYRPGWRNEAAFGGGGLFDWGSHFVDQLLQLMLPRRAVRVFAQMGSNVWSRDSDDFARVCIDFEGGVCGLVEINTTTTAPLPRWHIDGTNGSAWSPHSPEFDVQRWAELDFFPANGGASRRLPKAPNGLSEPQIWERFADAILAKAQPAVTAESVLPTMEVLDAARQSALKGVAIEILLGT
jgi:scyllo-inositol 2-dehydrogenase (NADP+)